MRNQPIYVTIQDNCNVARSLTWLARGSKWLPAGGKVVLDYDPWSCASAAQRVSIAAAAGNGSVAMSISVLGSDGKYATVPYCPGGNVVEPLVVDVGQPEPAAPSTYRPSMRPAVDTSTHTVVAGENKVAARLGLKATVVRPPEAGERNAYGFSVTENAAPAHADAGLDKKAVAAEQAAERAAEQSAEEAAEQATEEAAEDASDAAADDVAADREKYNALIADKKWADAYRLLKARFGEERITFSQRSLQYAGDWDALVAKHGLL